MKKAGWLLAAALLLAVYGGAAAQTILFSESFDSYATNETALDLEFSGDRNARVIADQPGGKAFLLPCGQEEGRLGAKIADAGEEVVVAARIKWEGARADAKIGMKDAGGRYLAAGLSQSGEITAPNGRVIGTVGLSLIHILHKSYRCRSWL